jgi:acyl-CoA synthetase (AMP-forming)/AMP-acid ligase II
MNRVRGGFRVEAPRVDVSMILQRRSVESPEAIALVFGDRHLTYREAQRAALSFAATVLRAGARPGGVVAILARNSLEGALAYLGAWAAGAVPAGINYRQTEVEIRRQLGVLDPLVVVADGELARLVDTCTPLVVVRSGAVREGDASGRCLEGVPGRPAAVFFTSGTTSDPRPILIGHEGLARNCRSVPLALGLGAGDRYVLATPLCHVGGVTRLLNALATGSTVDLLREWDADAFAARVAAGATHAMLLGPMLADVVELSGAAAAHVRRRLKLVYYGAGRTDRNLLESLVSRYPGLSLAQGWGATETSGSVTLLAPDDHRRAFESAPHLLGSVGRPLPGVRVEIENERIVVRADGLALGALQGTNVQPLVRDDGALVTNDIGELDEDGYLYVRGRTDDAIKSGGLTVLPARVEAALRDLPGVEAAAVVGAPDERLGERVVAFVVAKGFVDVEALRDHLAGFELPRAVIAVDAIPLTAAGKVDRRALRGEAARL